MKDKIKKIKKKDLLFLGVCLPIIILTICYIIVGWHQVVEVFNYYVDKILLTIFTLVATLFLQKITRIGLFLFKPKSQRLQTISNIIVSFINYSLGTACALVVAIYFLGYEYISTMIAGLGILALVLGLGCQALIADVVAGISMAIEGQFNVGDVVVVDNWRGKIKEIGLRTITLEDVSGNLQVINNSQVSKIINNSKELSICVCDIGIEYGESLERVENIISENLAEIAKNIPSIKKDLEYNGVQSLADSAVILRFTARAKEDDKFQVQRDMNRQFKLLFDKHNINIPFPHTTISNITEKEKSY